MPSDGGIGYMIIGNGEENGIKINNLALSTDVIGHEYGHAVIGSIPNLQVAGMNGTGFKNMALNESFADIFGYLTEGDENDWVIGNKMSEEDGPYKRCLDNPKSTGHYDHVNQIKGENQHKDSTVNSKAFSIITKKINSEISGQIYYEALTKYLYNEATLWDVRDAVIYASNIKYGDKYNSIIMNAYDEVGVSGKNIKSTPLKISYNANDEGGYYNSYGEFSIDLLLDKDHNVDSVKIVELSHNVNEGWVQTQVINENIDNKKNEYRKVIDSKGKNPGSYMYKITTLSGESETILETKVIILNELPDASKWEAGKQYKVDEQVKYGDKVYTCIKEHTSTKEWSPNGATSLWEVLK